MRSRSTQVWIKRLADRVGGVILILAMAPLLGLIAIAVKLEDGGPAFFCQPRVGLDRNIFRIWKFRTMVVEADRFLDAGGRVGKVDRITRVGRVLRRLSLDELPQALNIAKGEMSFIGPRPVLADHLPRYTEAQKQRFAMKPGVTGLAQVNGRNTLPWSQRLEYDVQYITNYSLWLDCKILLRTVKTVLLREGVVLDRNPEEIDDLPPAPAEAVREPAKGPAG